MAIIKDNILFLMGNSSPEEFLFFGGLINPIITVMPYANINDNDYNFLFIPNKNLILDYKNKFNTNILLFNDSKVQKSEMFIRLNKSFYDDMIQKNVKTTNIKRDKCSINLFISLLAEHGLAENKNDIISMFDKYVSKYFINDVEVKCGNYNQIVSILENLTEVGCKSRVLAKNTFAFFDYETRKQLFSLREVYENGNMFKDYDGEVVNFKKRKEIYEKLLKIISKEKNKDISYSCNKIKGYLSSPNLKKALEEEYPPETAEYIRSLLVTLKNKKTSKFLGGFNGKVESSDIEVLLVRQGLFSKGFLDKIKGAGINVVEVENIKSNIEKYSSGFLREKVIMKKSGRKKSAAK